MACRNRSGFPVLFGAAVAALGIVAYSQWNQTHAEEPQEEAEQSQQGQSAQGQPRGVSPFPQGWPDLPSALRDTPGCLGIELAQTATGKNVIFAWFENKKAVERFYYGEVHQGAMGAFFPGSTDEQKPLEGVPDDSGPLMVVASITMSDKANFEKTELPISQIAIEVYKPVTGGIYLGSRFAPDALKVDGMKDYSKEE